MVCREILQRGSVFPHETPRFPAILPPMTPQCAELHAAAQEVVAADIDGAIPRAAMLRLHRALDDDANRQLVRQQMLLQGLAFLGARVCQGKVKAQDAFRAAWVQYVREYGPLTAPGSDKIKAQLPRKKKKAAS